MQRRLVAERLERIYTLASSTGLVARFIVFGSFVTAKRNPGDVDVFMIMEDSFEIDQVTGEAAVVFDHPEHRMLRVPVYFGFVGWPRLEVSKLQ